MTRRQRAQVVELLRCACDPHALTQHYTNLGDAAIGLGLNPGGFNFWNTQSDVELLAMAAAADVVGQELGQAHPIAWGCSKDFVRAGLEAAARVEEGSWP